MGFISSQRIALEVIKSNVSSENKEALKIAIYLNDKYTYDAPSPNGYAGIL